ncbi:MAG: type II secretion system protein [Candidatus Saganbacteria bacterium]|nr:type II secretion system protein [Candidatus Saganbacteria bacterium]
MASRKKSSCPQAAGSASNKAGFTIIELLVAAGLFIVCLGTFSYLLRSSAASIADSRQLARAVYELQAESEELQEVPFASLCFLNGRRFAGGAGKISVTQALADLVEVRLELVWHENKVPLRLYTLRSNYK